jgi:hypothetical protein
MRLKIFILVLAVLIFLTLKIYAENIGTSQTGGENIGVSQIDAGGGEPPPVAGGIIYFFNGGFNSGF